jgi:hypothetical protein
MASFVKKAAKQVGDVREFLKSTAGGSSVKYVAEKGAKHQIYIPFVQTATVDQATGQEVVSKNIVAITAYIHDWFDNAGQFHSTACLKDVTDSDPETGALINDGTCPFCSNVPKAWEIYNYRKELEEKNCLLTGEDRDKHIKASLSTFRDNLKAKEAKPYLYLLIVKFKLNEQGREVIGSDGMPEYELKLTKWSASKAESIEKQLSNAGSEMEGAELIFQYPNTDDRRLLVSQSTISPVFPNNMITVRYPAVVNKINEDVAKFDWECISKAFSECTIMPVANANRLMTEAFKEWDKYNAALAAGDTNAKYLEYTVETNIAKPSLGTETPVMPQIPVVPGAQTQTQSQVASGMPQIPVVPGIQPGVQATPDLNAVFAGTGATAPTLTI